MVPTPAGHEIAPCISRARLLPQAMIKLISRYPDIKIVTNESGFTALVTELRAGEIDFIIGALRNEEMLLDIHSEMLLVGRDADLLIVVNTEISADELIVHFF